MYTNDPVFAKFYNLSTSFSFCLLLKVSFDELALFVLIGMLKSSSFSQLPCGCNQGLIRAGVANLLHECHKVIRKASVHGMRGDKQDGSR